MFIRIKLKDGRMLILNSRGIVSIEHLPPRHIVTLGAVRMATLWRWFRSPFACESIVLALDEDEARPLLEALDSITFDPES
jgi:hypothetical protein